jgi:hypothetical protein
VIAAPGVAVVRAADPREVDERADDVAVPPGFPQPERSGETGEAGADDNDTPCRTRIRSHRDAANRLARLRRAGGDESCSRTTQKYATGDQRFPKSHVALT